MILNRENLNIAFTGFKAAFQRGLSIGPAPLYTEIATVIPSSTSEEKYAWLGQMPRMREWLGDRVVQNIAQHDYAIKNRSFESTVGVDRDHIEDDQYGIYAPLMEEMGRSVRIFPDELVFGLIVNGFTTTCYDGQNFFAGGTAPLIAFATYVTFNAVVDPRIMMPAKDAEYDCDEGGATWAAWKIFNTAPADVSVDMDDEDFSALQSCYLQIS